MWKPQIQIWITQLKELQIWSNYQKIAWVLLKWPTVWLALHKNENLKNLNTCMYVVMTETQHNLYTRSTLKWHNPTTILYWDGDNKNRKNERIPRFIHEEPKYW
jgi:hypothetical protein